MIDADGATYRQQTQRDGYTFNRFGVSPLNSPLTPSCLIVRRNTSANPSYSYGNSAVPWACNRVLYTIRKKKLRCTRRFIGKTTEAPMLPLIAPMHNTTKLPTMSFSTTPIHTRFSLLVRTILSLHSGYLVGFLLSLKTSQIDGGVRHYS